MLIADRARAPTPAGRSSSRWSSPGRGLGLLVSQLNNYTLSPISEERVSEAAGVNSAGGSFGLSFGLAFAGAIMLATLSFAFTDMADDSTVLPAAQQQQVADALEDDAEVMSNTQLDEAARRPAAGRCRTRSSASTPTRGRARCRSRCSSRCSPASLGLLNSFRMMRLPDPAPSRSMEGMAFG